MTSFVVCGFDSIMSLKTLGTSGLNLPASVAEQVHLCLTLKNAIKTVFSKGG